MKKSLLAGALAFAVWGGAALADDATPANDQCNCQTVTHHKWSMKHKKKVKQDETAQANPSTSQSTQDNWREQTVPDSNTGIGGSAGVSSSATPAPCADQNANLSGSASTSGVSGTVNSGSSASMQPCQAAPSAGVQANVGNNVPAQPQTGGSGNVTESTSGSESTTTEAQPIEPLPSQQGASNGTTNVYVEPAQPAQPAYTQPVVAEQPKKKPLGKAAGLTVMAGAGVEGYTGALAPALNPGPAWGATASIKPTRVLGIELGYSGATNELRAPGNQASGPDIVRNGGHAAVTVALSPASIQPYLMGGVGYNHYNSRVGGTFRDDNSGEIPLGVGLRSHIGRFTADLRGNYDVGFSEDFASNLATRHIAGVNSVNSGRYLGMFQLGGTF